MAIGRRWARHQLVRSYVSFTLIVCNPNAPNDSCRDASVSPTIDPIPFPNTPENVFWTSTGKFPGQESAHGVNFANGFQGNYAVDLRCKVRLVRSAKILGSGASVFPNKLSDWVSDWAEARRLKAEQELLATERKAHEDRSIAERERNLAKVAKAAALRKIVASGAQAMYLQAGKAQRSGSITVNGVDFYASELYETLIERFPSSEFAVKATDQLSAIDRSERQAGAVNAAAAATERAAQAQRQADSNASSRAACFSSVRRCEANCSDSSVYGTCIQMCQRSCN